MRRFRRHALGAALTCYASASALAAPAFRILYHEAIRPQTQQVSGHTRNMTFEAYGRRFNLVLQPNSTIGRAVPAGRPEIETLKGEVEGQRGSWVRMTHTRNGWHGIISDGEDLYGVEPAADLAGALVHPSAGTVGSAPVMYRLKDALLPVGPVFCEILNPDGTVYTGPASSAAAASGRMTAQTLFNSIAAESATQVTAPDLELTVGVVADYQFYQLFSDDPEGMIIARMNVVDGIWSSQVGVKISLAPTTVLKTADQTFTKTVPADLLAQVRQYRGSHSAQRQTGVTHLMTGRDLDGDIVGIAYMGSVCDSQTADSLSEGNHSTLMSGLITAHELGHNFNAPHDGDTGACSTTPQTFLMAPKLNFSDQFSSCSLDQINARIKTAQCLVPYEAPDVQVELPATLVGAVENSAFTISFVAHAIGDDASSEVAALASLPANLTLQSATATGGGTCTSDGGSVTCSLGTLQAQETRQIDLTVVSNAVGNSTATVSVASSNDYVVDNNSAQVSVQISATSPASAPVSSTPNGNGSSGGGGGGSLDLVMLAVLGSGAAARAMRPRKQRPPSGGGRRE